MEGRFATQCHFIGNKLGGYDRNAWVGITEICIIIANVEILHSALIWKAALWTILIATAGITIMILLSKVLNKPK